MSAISEDSLRQLLNAVAKSQSSDDLPELHERLRDLYDTDDGIDPTLLGLAHLTCVIANGRHFAYAARRFFQAKRWDLLAHVWNLARQYGDIRTAWLIREDALQTDDCPIDVSDFTEWFKGKGIFWFDLYVDPVLNIASVSDADVRQIRTIVAFLFDDPAAFWADVLARVVTIEGYPFERVALLMKLAHHEQPTTTITTPAHDVDALFRAFAHAHSIAILRTLQEPDDENPDSSYVYQAIDNDGIVKVFKQVVSRDDVRMDLHLPSELEILSRLSEIDGVPRCHGVIELPCGVRFIKLQMCYGQTLLDFVRQGRRVSEDEACYLLSQIANILNDLHERGLVYLDLRPQNVLVSGSDVTLIDFNVARPLDKEGTTYAHIFDPRYAAPEMVLEHRATTKTDVFQLGVLFYQLLTGEHPFAWVPELLETSPYEESKLLKFALGSVVGCVYPLQGVDPSLRTLVLQMLDPVPDRRPTMAQVMLQLVRQEEPLIVKHPPRMEPAREREHNTVLFPARMGLPHRGHIDYMCRVMELGHFLKISIHRAYTITQDDPYPKWFIAKMVGQSLRDRGFRPHDDFEIVLTPYFETDQRTRMHFAASPDRADWIAVASSNPEIHDLFPEFPIYDQHAVFGVEGEPFEPRSWGAQLREAIRHGDKRTFVRLAATGVKAIYRFHELRHLYAQDPVEFVPGSVRVGLIGALRCDPLRVSAYSDPERTLIDHLSQEKRIEIIDPFTRYTELRVNGEPSVLTQTKTDFDGTNLTIWYELT